jgi:hypothetical protein
MCVDLSFRRREKEGHTHTGGRSGVEEKAAQATGGET